MNIIKDGTGTGYTAKVDSTGRIRTASDVVAYFTRANFDGKAFVLGSGALTMTTDTESGLIYLKNTGDEDLVVTDILIYLDDSTGGSGKPFITIYKNPTTGTVISNATAGASPNLNFGSSNTLDALVYAGGEGTTFTGEDLKFTLPLFQDYFVIDIGLVLPKGSSLGVGVIPPTGNTSQSIQATLRVFERDGI